MASSSRSSPPHLAINDEEALIHDFDGVSLGCNPSSESFCLVVKDNVRAPLKSHFKRDPFELANSIPFEEMNLPTLRQNHDLQDAVNQFLSPATSTPLPVFPHSSSQHQNFAAALASQAMVTSRESLPNQATASSFISSQNIQLSASPCSSLQSLLCAVSQVTMNEVPPITHIDKEQGTPTLLPTVSSTVSKDKGKRIQVPTSFVPQAPFRPLTIGGGTGTKRSFARQEIADYDDAQISFGAPASQSAPPSSIGASSQSWPKQGYFKLHVDAALNNHLQKTGIGAAVFNNQGEVVAALSSPLIGTSTPLLAEAKALLIALRWCAAVRFPLDCVASDCLILVNSLINEDAKNAVSFKLSSTGRSIPAVGFGTCKSTTNSVFTAIVEVGRALQSAMEAGVERRAMFVTSKIWCSDLSPDKVRAALNNTLRDLQIDCLDLYLLMEPFHRLNFPLFSSTFLCGAHGAIQ
ncbi:hypothetical protein F8388_022108 [Cannabis sativa]|uniref:RNase H type-1 domain-containing protein n=1 Tax=Cannabis sativa TaxID=3483 RepID=A0A7J6G7T1_CANSA|nr:hypothetical protein F8388_022108 [Cannabis sativa]